MDGAVKGSKWYLKGSHDTSVVTNFFHIYISFYVHGYFAGMHVCMYCMPNSKEVRRGIELIGTKVKERHKLVLSYWTCVLCKNSKGS